MRVFQIIGTIIGTNKTIMEDFKIGYEKIWIYARYDAGECTGHSGENNRCS